MENSWFTGSAELTTYHFEELLGTKLRALYQRKKGRDLYDLYTTEPVLTAARSSPLTEITTGCIALANAT